MNVYVIGVRILNDRLDQVLIDELHTAARISTRGRGRGNYHRSANSGRSHVDMGGRGGRDVRCRQLEADLSLARVQSQFDRSCAVRIAGPGDFRRSGKRSLKGTPPGLG